MAIEPDGIAVIDIAGSRTTRLPHREAQAIAGFDDQLWVVTRDSHLVRVDLSGRSLAGPPMALPSTTHGVLVSAPCGPAAAVWSIAAPIMLSDELGNLVRTEHVRADVVLPLTGRRYATVNGTLLTLPSGLITQLTPNSTVLGGVVMADAKRLALFIAMMGANGSERQLVVVSITAAQIVLRCATRSNHVRIATMRGLAIAQLEPRVFWGVDLRSGRELGLITLDRNVIEYALDPTGRWLAVRGEAGEVELLDITNAVRATAAIGTIPTRTRAVASDDVENTTIAANPMNTGRSGVTSTAVEFTRNQHRIAPAGDRPIRATAGPSRIVPRLDACEQPTPGQRSHTEIVARGRFTHGRFILPSNIDSEITERSAADHDDVIAVFPCGVDDVDDGVVSAAGALAHWSSLTVDMRIDVLARIEQPLRRRFSELAALMHRELGRPGWECQRELDGLLPRMADLFAFARKDLGQVEQHRAARTHHRPLGVVAILAPVMLPLATSHSHILAALIAGNTVVWKPSPLVAASAQLYIEILQAAGLPPGVINLVHGNAAVGQRLLAHPRVDAAVFIGNREHAREIRRASCERLEMTLLLHVGSKNPAVVMDDADLDHAASEIVQGAFFTAGQRCTAVSRVLVYAKLLDPFLDALVKKARQLSTHIPTFMGPMFSRDRYERFFAQLADVESRGASVILRPETRLDSLHVGPSIHLVTEHERAADYLGRELFGPDLAVEPVADLTDAMARLGNPGTLFASLFGKDTDSRRRFERGVQAGASLWNHTPIAVSGRLSFAAKGTAERGTQAIQSMTHRTVHCEASTCAGLSFDLTCEVHESVLARVRGGRS